MGLNGASTGRGGVLVAVGWRGEVLGCTGPESSASGWVWCVHGWRVAAVVVKLCAIFQQPRGRHMHTSTLRAAGGSIALTIPQPLARLLSLHAGEAVTLEAEGGRLVIAPQRRKRYTSADLVAMQAGAPLLTDDQWDAMPATGTEAAL